MAADTRHDCPGGCGARVARSLLACRGCWWRLPLGLRFAVNEAYAAKRRNPADASRAVAHRVAVADALAWYRGRAPGGGGDG